MTTARQDSVSESTCKGASLGLVLGFFSTALCNLALDGGTYRTQDWPIVHFFLAYRFVIGPILGANIAAILCFTSAKSELRKPVPQKTVPEPSKESGTNFLKRAMCAVPAGMIAGVWVETLASEFAPTRGALCGALVAGVVCCVFQIANSQFIDRYLQCLLAGMLAGLLWGVFWHSSSKYAEYLEQSKKDGSYQFVVSSTAGIAARDRFVLEGLRYGIPVGAAAGFVLGVGIHIYWRRNSAVGDVGGSPG